MKTGRVFFAAVVVGGLLSSICLGYSGGSGTAGEPYKIASKDDLLYLANHTADYNKCFILTADVNMEGQVFTTAIIGAKNFTGSFDGNDHKIINSIINSGNGDVGLFGEISPGGAVKNLGVENFSVSSSSTYEYAGCLVGRNEGALNNCYSTGDVNGAHVAGGLVGDNFGGTISNCNSMGLVSGAYGGGGLAGQSNGSIENCHSTVSVSGGSIGGIVMHNWGSISNCYSTGNITGSYAGGLCDASDGNIINCYSACVVNGSGQTGGLCGGNSGNIINCYFIGTVTVTGGSFTGGLCGVNSDGTISNCYSTGNVSGSNFTGGLCGTNWGGIDTISIISNCYSTGKVVGGGYTGGLCGNNWWDNGSIISSYFLNTAGPDNGLGTPKTDAQMKQQSSFAGWDFVGEIINGPNDIWKICEGTNYPKLAWQIPLAGDFVCPDGVEMNDLAVLCDEWLLEEIPADVWPKGGDGIVDFFDWAVFANQWEITVDYEGLADFAEQWLKTGARYCIADIAPEGGDRIVNMPDFAVFANNWLEGL